MQHFLPFERNPKIAVAVSGGPDSLALMLLVYIWNRTVQGTITVLTVNHNLRPEAVEEAQYVNDICKDLHLQHITLEWKHDGINSNIQARARQSRYQLLTEYCQQHDILHLMCGHHADDLVENFFIRLLRGSGLAGLTSNNVYFYNNVRIIRPLLNVTKPQLQKYLNTKNIQWITDPSNNNNKYLRSEVRNLLHSLSNISSYHKLNTDLIRGRVVLTQSHLNRAVESINSEILYAMTRAVNLYPAGFTKINHALFFQASEEARYAILAHLLMIIGSNMLPPRFASLEKLMHNLAGAKNNYVQTLHGCIIQYMNNEIFIYKEFGRHLPTPQPLKHLMVWDSRFRVICSDLQLDNHCFKIDCLNESEYQSIKLNIQSTCALNQYYRKNILFTFPVVKHLEKVVAIPHINYYNDVLAKKSISFIFEPQLTSHWFHFS